MDNKLIQVVIAITVGIIVLGSLLVPVITETSSTEKTYDNTSFGYYEMKPLETGDLWSYSDGIWSYNDQPITINNTDGNRVSIVASNNEVIRQDGLTRGTSYVSGDTSSVESIVVDDVNYLKIDTTNVAYTSGYGAVPNGGDYILKKYDSSGYVRDDTPLWVTGFTNLTTSSNSQLIVHIEGTIKDGLTITATPKVYAPVTDISIGEYTLNYEPVEEGIDLYKITSVSFDVTGSFNDEETTTTFTYSTFVIPKEVTTELTHHLDASEIGLLAVIPVLIIVALLVFAVRIFAGNRD